MIRTGLLSVVVVLLVSLGVLVSAGGVQDKVRPDPTRTGSVAATRTEASPSTAASPSTKVPVPASTDTGILGRASDDPLGALESPTATEAPAAATPVPVVDIVTTNDGWELALGTTPIVGTGGPLVTYRVEREPGIDVMMDEFLPTVVAVLEDPDRGWTATGRHQFQRVDGEAAIRVVLASPATVDARCAEAGLRTNGRFSCWVGNTAMLNVTRWHNGASDFADLEAYRAYLVNHEVGHGLGMGHAGCPEAGAPAPVMMQQTKTTGACVANGWPTTAG